MIQKKINIEGSQVQCFFDAGFGALRNICDKASTILVTDENVLAAYPQKFKGWRTLVLKPGEEFKQQAAVDALLKQLIELQADRSTTLVGVGGGVVTDMVGYAAAVYMRGIKVGFVPTSLLAMVDASIGGKNGVDVGHYKNLVGTIRQPSFLLYDAQLLQTLPECEWQNGFAEIIKHAAIKNAAMFKLLEANDLAFFQKKKAALKTLIMQNALLKTAVVQKDPFEKGDRKLLNFGHTLGHAIENDNQLSHGQAVAVGMVYAAHLSHALKGFKESLRLIQTIEQYGLPTHANFDMQRALQNIRLDKKRLKNEVHYVLLEKIGKGIIEPIAFKQLEQIFSN
ncbi:MAG TPA: 3-dehydroquinate synthase [Phnomibacter sp.]|nr:3-dehydroquinate synthase [Phnomibacter sp.]